ncbi:WAT1-related protein At1g25270-like isoform X5 [Benincasa hispida]|uniref:WAT1-related protein At1g25270-like isoform X5 n=1 Tax=Benincasa hispida TaxID=102211 RepID=UPI001900D976|nr:WAT1-related protein At1g25270-like isoform X5 [Benincasa hispida]
MNERVLWDGLPTILMVLVQFGFAGVNICYKLAAADGMSLKIIIAYRFLFASAFILPIAFFLERGRRPKLTWSVLFYAFLCGLFGGSLSQNLYVESLALTSATFASAIGNLVPGITFILAVSFRFKFITYMLERMNIRTMGGKAKVVGTLIGLGGAMVLTLYKGVELHLWSTRVDLLNKSHNSSGHVAAPEHDIHSQVLGSVLGVGSCFSYALWLIVQAKMSECYPCHYSSTALMCMMGSLQAVGFALCVETQWTRWKLGDRGFWSNGNANNMVRTNERPNVCISFQSSYSISRCHSRLLVPTRKTLFRMCDWRNADCVWIIHSIMG